MLDMCVWLYDGASVVVGGEHRYRLVDDVEAALQEIGVDTVAVTDRGRFLLLRLAPTAQHEGETRTQ